MATGMFKLDDELGRGGMGVVYRSYHHALCKDVAIKVLLFQSNDHNRPDAARFKREMEVLIGLEHPNIVKVLDAGVNDGQLYYVMELLDAQDLNHMSEATPMMDGLDVLRIIDQILGALNYIHGKGLLHRDIKPANIMIERSGRAVLMDFGAVHRADESSLAQGSSIIGTLNYMAPERLTGKPAGPPSDLWSLGVVAYRLLTGRLPFRENSAAAILGAVLRKEPAHVDDLRPGLPPGLGDYVMRYLVKLPEARFRSAAEARQALRGLKLLDSPAAAHGPVVPPATRTAKRRQHTHTMRITAPLVTSSRPRWLVPLLVTLLVAIVGGGIAWTRWQSGILGPPVQKERAVSSAPRQARIVASVAAPAPTKSSSAAVTHSPSPAVAPRAAASPSAPSRK